MPLARWARFSVVLLVAVISGRSEVLLAPAIGASAGGAIGGRSLQGGIRILRRRDLRLRGGSTCWDGSEGLSWKGQVNATEEVPWDIMAGPLTPDEELEVDAPTQQDDPLSPIL